MEDEQSNTDLETRWQNLMRVRGEYAAELKKMSSSLPGAGRKHLRKLSNWFKRPTKLDAALKRPDVLAVCLPLLTNSQPDPASLSGVELEQAARLGFCSLGRDVGNSRRLLRIFLYPILIFLATMILAIGFSFFLAPQFQEMFEEFGIELPAATKFVITASESIRQWWLAIVAIPLLACLLVWVLDFAGRSSRPANLGWIDHRLMSTRNALACWAWHVALLLEAGVGQQQAVETAGSSTGNHWLRQLSLNWNGNQDAKQDFLSNHHYQLLSNAMELPPSPGKIAALRQIAAYYWDRNRNTGDWWIHWLIAFFLWMVGITVLCTIVSLFMPLIAIVSGLTSNK